MADIENIAGTETSRDRKQGAPVRGRRANGRDTKQRILAAARSIIIENGTDSLSIDHVIREAGVSKGAFMYHFHTRQDLIEALVDEYAAHLGEVEEELVSRSAGGCSMLDAYTDWYRMFTSGEIDSGTSPLVALAMSSRDNRKFMSPVRDWYRRYFDRVEKQECGAEKALVFTLAYDGLFFHHLFGIDVMSPTEKRLIAEALQTYVAKDAE